MKQVYTFAALLLFCGSVFSQSLASQYVNVKGWKGSFKMTVVESDPLTGVTYTTTAEGPATVMNPNPKNQLTLMWPQPNYSNVQVPNLSGLDPSNPNYAQQLQAAMQASQNVNNDYFQWNATIAFKYQSKMNEFPIDVRDISCLYSGTRMSELILSIITNEKGETLFGIKGVAGPVFEKISCSGSSDGQAISSKEQLPNPSVLKYMVEASAQKKLNTKLATIADTATYTDGNKKVTISYNFTAIH